VRVPVPLCMLVDDHDHDTVTFYYEDKNEDLDLIQDERQVQNQHS
jgi:hypothetical protein